MKPPSPPFPCGHHSTHGNLVYLEGKAACLSCYKTGGKAASERSRLFTKPCALAVAWKGVAVGLTTD